MTNIKIIGSILPDHIESNVSQVSVGNARTMRICSQLGTAMPLFNNAVYDENASS
jgi:hypothetical protein